MATGGVFKLITNDGKQDRLIMATEVLQNRLKAIAAARAASGAYADPTPTLNDIEKTHILFMNAHFKPFAAIGYEYNKITPQAGNVALGETVTFSIPQFGDFFGDMALHAKLRQPTLVVDAGTAESDQPLMRWCPYPGERLCKKVSFDVNANPLDGYSSHATVFNRLFQVAPNKKIGWDRLMGQDEPLNGYVEQPNWIRSGVAAAAVTHRTAVAVDAGNQAPTGQKDISEAGDVDVIAPLLFWFNRDPRMMIASVAIPYGQRFLSITLANQNELVNVVPRGNGDWANPRGQLVAPSNPIRKLELFCNNIFVNPEVHAIYIKRIGFTLIRVHREQTFSASNSSDSVLLQQMKWPIEYMQVGMKLEDYVSSSEVMRRQYLDVWDRFALHSIENYSDTNYDCFRREVLTGSYSVVPGVGVVLSVTAPTVGLVTGVGTSFDTELLPGDFIVIGGIPYAVDSVTSATALNLGTANQPLPPADVALTVDFFKYTRTPKNYLVSRYTSTIDAISIVAHGINIFNDFNGKFFNAYLPYVYGGPNLNTPEDCGAMFVNFCLYPNSYQPSGHINVSRAREFYLNYTSSIISSSVRGLLVVVASAINFLLISDGSAVLRYST